MSFQLPTWLRTRSMKRSAWVIICAGFLSAYSIAAADLFIHYTTHSRLYSNTAQMPHRHTGLVLGTAPMVGEYQNLYFRYRVEAAAELMRTHRVDVLLISGDNSRSSYDEPTAMRDSLIAKGVDSNSIVLDYAGFRTFDSMVRAKEIFSQDSIVIISQSFHNERALYIADRIGMHAIAFNAADVDNYYGIRTRIREKFARLKTILDFYIGTQPHFLGQKIMIP